MAQSNAPKQAPKEGHRGRNSGLKKISTTVQELKVIHRGKTVRLMFQDEAGFGRINNPKYCWCEKGIRPGVPCQHIREYRYCLWSGRADPALLQYGMRLCRRQRGQGLPLCSSSKQRLLPFPARHGLARDTGIRQQVPNQLILFLD